jgi:hypothetical protein
MLINRAIAEKQAKKFHFKGDIKELEKGLRIEQEHKNVINNLDGWTKISIAHLDEKKNYYTLLKKVEG